QSALAGASDHLLAILIVLLGTEGEKHARALALQVRRFVLKLRDIRDRCDALELRLERLDAGSLNGVCTHARRVEIADLLVNRALAGLGDGRRFQDLPQDLLIVILERIETAPTGVLGLNRIALDPAAAGVIEEF